MEAHFLKELPVLIIDLFGGIIGFVLAIGWWKASGRALDKDSTVFIAKVLAGITVFSMVLAFVI